MPDELAQAQHRIEQLNWALSQIYDLLLDTVRVEEEFIHKTDLQLEECRLEALQMARDALEEKDLVIP